MNATPQQMSRVYGAWSAANVVAGGALWAGGRNVPAREFGRQTFAWGVVNSAITTWMATRPAPKPSRLRRIVLINAVADLGYMAIGAALYRHGRRPDGAAIIVQGAFLLALDGHYGYHLPKAP